jgi:hypothetical protein
MTKLRLHSLLAAACIFVAGIGQADAREFRHDALELVSRFAESRDNRSSVRQEGDATGAAIVQNGTGNSAGIRQYGNGHTGTITQNGDDNAACLIQVGRGLDGSITQTGDNHSSGVIQTRHGTREIPPELCMIDSDRRGFWMSTARRATRSLRR